MLKLINMSELLMKPQKVVFLAVAAFLFVVLHFHGEVWSGQYIDSSHGNATYGVDRKDAKLNDNPPNGYSKGNCAHCHEQHASIDGGEPAPASGAGPSPYALFAPNHTNQTTNFCFNCHVSTGSIQDSIPALENHSYSFRAGNWSADTVNGIKEAFSLASSHSLDDISAFIAGRWGYTSNSNPCVACHNPHAVQGDPANNPSSPKSNITRGYPLSRPSAHAVLKTWGLWGQAAAEKMDAYVSGSRYQAPYRFGSTTAYEPDGSGTTDGSNLTDFVTFCTDCHDNSTDPADDIASTSLGRNLYKFDWTLEKHGFGAATDESGPDHLMPYVAAQIGQYVFACTDCHESHGSPNVFLIRKEVNASTLTVTLPGSGGDWTELCKKCHDYYSPQHHVLAGAYSYNCLDCHTGGGGGPAICSNCHYHGSTEIQTNGGVKTIYNGGEHLF